MKQALEGVSMALRELSGVFDTELVLEGSVMNSLQRSFEEEYKSSLADAVALSLHPQTIMLLTDEVVRTVPAWAMPHLGSAGVLLSHIANYTTGTNVLVVRDARLLWTEADIVWKR